MPEEDKTEKLLLKMKRTKSNRFNMSERLRSKAEYKSISINILSVSCIISSIFLLSYSTDMTVEIARLTGAIVAAASIVSMALSLQNPVSDLARRAAEAHECARRISEIYGQLEHGVIPPEKAREEYEKTLNAHQENHAELDNKKTLYERKFEFPEDSKKICYLNASLPYSFSKYISLLSIPVTIIVIIISICASRWAEKI